MRHRVAGKKLNRSGGHRRALLRNLVSELIRHERIKTTEAKARAVRPMAERLVTKARKAQAERVVELAKQRDVRRLSAWFNAKRAGQLIELVEQGDEEGLGRMAQELALHARRQVLATLTDRGLVRKLVEEIAPRYIDRPGGYTRIIKLGPRKGDAAPMAILELVE
ncbi:MAG TPA: 50S ribosomal protein L17 [Anaerolineales bacterium]|nr:50S ribosomal protein L17 [Anaerolineae bacterium]HIQ01783.1 50S ribosomal protein L17 [Anaerolineales bacterium]